MITNRDRLKQARSGARVNARVNAVELHDPSPVYLRRLADATGLSDKAVAERIGVSGRALRAYMAIDTDEGNRRTAPYSVQVALEALAKKL